MVRPSRLFQKILTSRNSIPFRDFERVLAAFGFRLDRIAGSHHIFVHPNIPRPLSIQRRGKEAKPYQLRQFLDMVEIYGLTIGDE